MIVYDKDSKAASVVFQEHSNVYLDSKNNQDVIYFIDILESDESLDSQTNFSGIK